MGPPPSHSRRSSGASAKGDAYQPPIPQDDAFCNNFWSGRNGQGATSTFEGKEGFEMLMSRMKAGTKTLEDLRSLFKERLTMEEEYAKKLSRLSKTTAGAGEMGHIERAIMTIKGEIDTSARVHSDLAMVLKQQEAQLANFLGSREAARKTAQVAVEKAWRVKREQRDVVNKAKAKYEADAVNMTGMHAQAALSQGRELDKVTAKMDKISQTVVVNEKEYRKCVDVLRDTTLAWNGQWKSYCDLCQDQEEERLAFVKARLWDWANALSTVAMAEDESSERSRVSLEQCEPATDLQIFVRHCGTGTQIPDPPPFVDYKLKEGPLKQTFQNARFPRTSTRKSGITHSPSAVEDITKIFKSQPPQQPLQAQPHLERNRSSSPGKNQAPQNIPQSVPSSRPPLGESNNSSNLDSALQRPQITENTSQSSMFAPSRHNAASRAARGGGSSEQPGSPAAKDGQIAASAFRRRGMSTSQLADIPTPPISSPAPARYDAPAPANQPEDDPDDPLLRALNHFNNTPSQPSTRTSRGPAPGAVALPGMGGSPARGQPQQRGGGGSSTDLREQSQYSGMSPAQQEREAYNRRPHSRAASPTPTANLMQPPKQPGEPSAGTGSFGQGGDRPPSRQGSNNSRGSNRPQQSQPFPGIGARGNSPGPQPYNTVSGPPRVASPAGPRVASPGLIGNYPQPQPQAVYQQGPPGQPQQNWAPSPSQAQGPPPSNYGGSQHSQMAGYAASTPQQHNQPPFAQQQQQYQSNQAPPQAAYSHQQQSSQHSISQYPSGQYPQQSPSQPPPSQQSFGYQQQIAGSSPNVNGHAQYGSQPYEQPQQSQGFPGQAPQHAPTGQFDENGLPILFYVNAIYDYQASGPEEFSFSKGDVIAVTKTEADGWWQGRHVGVGGGGNIFPSNFTELLP